MPEMGRCRFHRCVCADEAVRGQSHSRRHSQARLQNTPDQARDIRVIDFRGDAFGLGLAARAKARLVPDRSLGEGESAHVEAAVYTQNVPSDVRSHRGS
jgi:hypothetical protein